MGFAARLEKLIPDLAAALLRFPVPALYSILLCAWLNIAEIGGSSWDEDVAYAAAAGFLASVAAHYFAEAGLSRLCQPDYRPPFGLLPRRPRSSPASSTQVSCSSSAPSSSS
jgi:hypothetical protein